MAQYVFTMNRLSKVVPPKREILSNISLSFFPGAKIGVLGLNGSGKSTLLRIMAGVDQEYNREARPQPGIKIGYLSQEPPLDPNKDVRGNVEEGVSAVRIGKHDERFLSVQALPVGKHLIDRMPRIEVALGTSIRICRHRQLMCIGALCFHA